MPQIAYIKSVLAVSIIVGAFYFGTSYNERKWQARVNAAEAEQLRLTIELERVQAGNAYLLEESLAEILEEKEIKTRVVYKNVIKYRENPNINKCHLSSQWVQIHNSAAGLPESTETTSSGNVTK